MPEIKVENLSYNYGKQEILSAINMELEKGKVYGILGPNGSGKTTLLKNILRILEPSSNSIYLDQTDITTFSVNHLARRIAAVPQDTTVDFDFSVLDIVLMGRTPYLRRFQVEGENDVNIAKKAMEITDTWRLKDKSIKTLSGGERQRVIVARAMVQQTDILLLDEPISHLDIHHQVELMDTIANLASQKGITVLVVLHDINMAAQYSDSLILLNAGKIVAAGTPEEVIQKQVIEQVYKIKCCIIKNPVTSKPHVIPIGK